MANPDKSVIVKISVSHTYASEEHFNVTHCVLGISSWINKTLKDLHTYV